MTTLTYWLGSLLLLAAGLCVWAFLTAQERPAHRAPRHAQWKQVPTRTWYMITDESEIQPWLPTRADMPWTPPRKRDFPWPPADDHALDE